MKLTYVKDRKGKGSTEKIWFLHLTYKEGIAMAASILNQINKRDPNSARLESWTEDGTYVSVSVDLDDTELQLRNKIKELQERANNNYLRSWGIPPKERKITKPKGAKNGLS